MSGFSVDDNGPYRLVYQRSGPDRGERVKVYAFRRACEECGNEYWAWAEDKLDTCARCRAAGAFCIAFVGGEHG